MELALVKIFFLLFGKDLKSIVGNGFFIKFAHRGMYLYIFFIIFFFFGVEIDDTGILG